MRVVKTRRICAVQNVKRISPKNVFPGEMVGHGDIVPNVRRVSGLLTMKELNGGEQKTKVKEMKRRKEDGLNTTNKFWSITGIIEN